MSLTGLLLAESLCHHEREVTVVFFSWPPSYKLWRVHGVVMISSQMSSFCDMQVWLKWSLQIRPVIIVWILLWAVRCKICCQLPSHYSRISFAWGPCVPFESTSVLYGHRWAHRVSTSVLTVWLQDANPLLFLWLLYSKVNDKLILLT